jgi:DNA-binding MarR family transcriptional regulator
MQDVIGKICNAYGVRLDTIKHPSGKKERATRRHVITILNRNHGISVSAIAKGLNISKGLVSMTLSNEEY